jgi:hypothetical protein
LRECRRFSSASETRRENPQVVALSFCLEREDARRARRSSRRHVSRARQGSVEKSAQRSFPAALWRASRHSRASSVRRSPLRPSSMSEAKNPTRCPWCAAVFQAARGREASGSASRAQRIIVRKIRRKSLRHELKPNDDLLSIRRGTSPSNREIMAKTQPNPSRASTDCYGLPVSVEVCCAIACVNLR